eukprot:scaffold1800_cov387-Prasinococcus_capsulatus_cf.AAC.3
MAGPWTWHRAELLTMTNAAVRPCRRRPGCLRCSGLRDHRADSTKTLGTNCHTVASLPYLRSGRTLPRYGRRPVLPGKGCRGPRPPARQQPAAVQDDDEEDDAQPRVVLRWLGEGRAAAGDAAAGARECRRAQGQPSARRAVASRAPGAGRTVGPTTL